MQLLSHRGYWQHEQEKNSYDAIMRSLEAGFGCEIDIRDHQQEIVISHDMASDKMLKLSEIISLLNEYHLPLALNIKADGLASTLSQIMKKVNNHHWFVFDMSIPDMLDHMQHNNPFYTRVSDIETNAILHQDSRGIWLDSFYDDEWQIEKVEYWLIQKNKSVCLVSSELHQRDPMQLWKQLKASNLIDHINLYLCTDYPLKAKKYFGL